MIRYDSDGYLTDQWTGDPYGEPGEECETCGGSGLMYPHPNALVALNCWACKGTGRR